MRSARGKRLRTAWKRLKGLRKVGRRLSGLRRLRRRVGKLFRRRRKDARALYQWAERAFQRGKLADSVERYRRVEAVSARALREFARRRNQEKYWWKANWRLTNSLLVLGKKKEALACRSAAFERAGGRRDVTAVARGAFGSAFGRIKSGPLPGGNSCYYCYRHTVSPAGMKLVEKCCRPKSREPQVYRVIAENELFEGNRYASTPRLEAIVEGEHWVKLFLHECAGAVKCSAADLEEIDFRKLGAALGEISLSFRSIYPERDDGEMYPLRFFDPERAYRVFEPEGGTSGEELGKTIRSVQRFFARRKAVEAVRRGLPPAFCHNDAGLQNVFMRNGAEVPFAFIDWEQVRWNTAGADIGSVLSSTKMRAAEKAGIHERIEEALIAGYRERQWGRGVPGFPGRARDFLEHSLHQPNAQHGTQEAPHLAFFENRRTVRRGQEPGRALALCRDRS